MRVARLGRLLRTFWRAHRFVLRTDRYHVDGSHSGEDRDLAWVKDLRAQPKATATVRAHAITVVARELAGAEREAIFERFVQADDSCGVHRDRTSREIRVVELRPAEV
jgi:glycine cleavage system aminomethyltransferase T